MSSASARWSAALLTVTSRNPIYSALWFASVVLSTAGLFLLAGAQFLAAGTVIVYAGAIIVTFLFVIMLAQMEGKAAYDRAARAPGHRHLHLLPAFLVPALHAGTPTHRDSAARRSRQGPGRRRKGISFARTTWARFTWFPTRILQDPSCTRAQHITSSIARRLGAEKPNVAGLGESLYTDHLVTVELAGALLFVALIAAVAITNPKRPIARASRPAHRRENMTKSPSPSTWRLCRKPAESRRDQP